MSFSLEQYTALRPFLYHVTARENLTRLRRTRRLDTTTALLAAAGRPDLLRRRRDESVRLLVDDEVVVLKDQKPLIEANTSLAAGWSFGDFVRFLNDRVFFWPGDALGAVAAGRRLLAHYEPDAPAVLRVRVAEFLATNPSAELLFCPYNSGAPRMQRGKPVPRGPDLFRPAAESRRKPHEVIEVATLGCVTLPRGTEFAAGTDRWQPLLAAAD